VDIWPNFTKDDVVFTPYKEGPDMLVLRCYRERITAHTSARRGYATKYVNVSGNFLHCIREIQIYLRIKTVTRQEADARTCFQPIVR